MVVRSLFALFLLFVGAINRSGSSLSLSFGPLLLDLIKPPFIQIQTADVEEVASHEWERVPHSWRRLSDVRRRLEGQHRPLGCQNVAGSNPDLNFKCVYLLTCAPYRIWHAVKISPGPLWLPTFIRQLGSQWASKSSDYSSTLSNQDSDTFKGSGIGGS